MTNPVGRIRQTKKLPIVKWMISKTANQNTVTVTIAEPASGILLFKSILLPPEK